MLISLCRVLRVSLVLLVSLDLVDLLGLREQPDLSDPKEPQYVKTSGIIHLVMLMEGVLHY